MKFKHLSLTLFLGLALCIFSGCEKESIDTHTIIEEDPDVTTTIVDCNNWQMTIGHDGSGTLSAIVGGGTAPFTYLWSTDETTETITVTTDGIYTVTVTDTDNCVLEDEITVTIDNCQSFTGQLEENSPGNLSAIVSGGTAPYSYLWSTGEAGFSEITVTQNGTYIVEIMDANGCVLSFAVEVTLADPCENFSAVIESDPSTATLSVNAAGGTSPYAYQWNTNATTSSISNILDGEYSVTVTDANGCVIIDVITVSPPCNDLIVMIENPQATTLFTNYSGGTAPYTFQWSTGETTSGINAPGSGTYSVTLTDTTGCTATDEIIIL